MIPSGVIKTIHLPSGCVCVYGGDDENQQSVLIVLAPNPVKSHCLNYSFQFTEFWQSLIFLSSLHEYSKASDRCWYQWRSCTSKAQMGPAAEDLAIWSYDRVQHMNRRCTVKEQGSAWSGCYRKSRNLRSVWMEEVVCLLNPKLSFKKLS